MTKREASEATCRALCEAVDAYFGPMFDPGPGTRGHTVYVPLAAYRAESTPLRTRAEVDAELVVTLRAYMIESYQTDSQHQDKLRALWATMSELCAEPTAPEPAAKLR